LIRTATTYRELAKADLFIEAVFERLDVKQQVLRAIDEVAPEGAVIASNTSGLDMDMLASFTRRPADVVGTHFFSPAHAMRLVEVVRGRATSQGTLSTVLALARRIAKLPVVVGVCDGFVGNRMLARYIAAADLLVRQGAAPEQVDAALERFGFAMGPFRMGDLAGLDVAQAGRRRRAAANPGRDYSQVADALCDAGRLGQKTGAGWYRYVDGSRTAHPDPAVAEIVQRWRDANGLRPRRIEEREIVERCVFALANEGARVLEEGIAGSAADIDVIYVNGYGFSSSRGGPMHFTQETGLTQVLCSLQAYASESGADPSWEPAPLLRRLAQSGAMHWNMKETAE
jgi:3-hydroxyacyl-CoA dehydrogenase